MKKTILITGASSGIGRATAEYFADKGWNVAATMRSPEKETQLTESSTLKLYKLDVTNHSNIEQCLAEVISNFGKIDVLLNNAGFGAVGVFEKSTSEDIKHQFEVNVFGLMDLSRAIIPHFKENREGTLINITSVGGKMTFPLYSIYNSSKWAVEGFSEALKFELRQFNIKVRVVEPGPIKTDFYGRSQNLFENDSVTGYEELENRVLKKFEKVGKGAPGPEIVAKTVYDAATDKGFKLRYPVGLQAGFILIWRKLLPSRLYNKIVSKTMT
jgi:short-subunit dehydrogenase